tara:strand:+ start:72 stop:272 length:201 start_codon:yes stop_codon:yes gene_type:complete
MVVAVVNGPDPREEIMPNVINRKSSDFDRHKPQAKRRFRRIWAFWAAVALLWVIAAQQVAMRALSG